LIVGLRYNSKPKPKNIDYEVHLRSVAKISEPRVKNGKDSIETGNEIKKISGKVKYCPTCGSTKIFWASGLPQLWSIWECKECGYRGALVLEDGKLGAKLRKEWKKRPKFSPTRV